MNINEPQIFKYGEIPVRTIELDSEPWWVLADVCRVLDIANHKNVAARLDEDEKGVHLMDTLGGNQQMTIINESGLYSVILRSEKPGAKDFKRWITHEVIPAIRKTGAYNLEMSYSNLSKRDWLKLAEIISQTPRHMANALYVVLEELAPGKFNVAQIEEDVASVTIRVPEKSEFANRLLKLMDEREINGPTLAKKIGCARNVIWYYTTGKCVPQRARLKEISIALGVEPDYFLK